MAEKLRTITSANSTLILTIPLLYPAPQKIEQFAVDDMWSLEQVDLVETQTGADGNVSFGYTPTARPFSFTLQANSPSVDILQYYMTAMEAQKEVYGCSIVLSIPSIKKSYSMADGAMVKAASGASGKKVLAPLQYGFMFASIKPSILA